MDNTQLKAEIDKMQSGNFSDYEAFYNLTSPIIHSLLLIATGDEATANFLITEVYNIIYANIKSVQDVNMFYKWAGLVAIDTAQRNMKNFDVEELEEVDLVFERAADDAAGIMPERIIIGDAFIKPVEARISEMKPLNRIIALYFYYAGLNISEIAVRTCRDNNAIKKIIAKIRMDLLPVVNRNHTGNDVIKSGLYELGRDKAFKVKSAKKRGGAKLFIMAILIGVILGCLAAYVNHEVNPSEKEPEVTTTEESAE